MGNEKNTGRKAVEQNKLDFVVVWGEFGRYRVTRVTAAWIATQVDRRFKPKWITFEDLFDSLVRVRTKEVKGFEDSTPAIRERYRNFAKAIDREDEEDEEPKF